MFVLGMVLIFLFASFIHPKEFRNIIFGLIFFLMIPSTYVFLSLYSLINLNVINWGTREAVAKAMGKAPRKESGLEKLLRSLGVGEDGSAFSRAFSFCFQSQKDFRYGDSEVVRRLERRLERSERLINGLYVSAFEPR